MAPGLVNEVLEVHDEALEILGDCRTWFVRAATGLLAEADPVPEKAETAFTHAVGIFFDDRVASERCTFFDSLGDMTASNIALVGESDLELEIRLGEFAARLSEANGSELWRIYLRFVTLLGRPDLSPGDNPVGPKALASGLAALIAAVDEEHSRALERVDHIEDVFSELLPELYAGLNQFLIGRNVSAAQATIVTAPDASAAAPRDGRRGGIVLDPAVELQRSLLGPAGCGSGGTGAGAGGDAGTGASAAASLLTQAMFGQLLARLDDLERGVGLGEAIPRPLDSARLGVLAGAPEAATIDALALIFEAIFASPTLPDPVKAALSSLQIPLLRAAILDPGFFTADAHPARQLLDKMARAAIGLPFEVSSRHPLCAVIQQIATHVRAEFVNDTRVLSRYVGELDKVIARRDKAAAQEAAAYRPLVQQIEQGDQAELRSRQAIDEFCLRPEMPPEISGFLRDHWQRALRQVWLEFGEGSGEWNENRTVIEKLLWSIQPKVDLADRQKLARELPGILQKISAGMERAAVPEAVRGGFLDACFSLQTIAMRGVAVVGGVAQPVPPAKRPPEGSRPALSEVRNSGRRLRIVDLGGAARSIARQRHSAVRSGEWLTFRLGDEEAICGRVSHVARGTGKLLLANPDWDFAVLLHPAIAESQVTEGKASVSSRVSLFNAAAEHALRSSPRPS